MRWRRVSGKFRMEDGWVDYKRRKKWAWEGNFLREKILDAWENFERLKEIREKEKKKRENPFFQKRVLKMVRV